MNKVLLVGNLGKDPEIRSTANGTAVATLSLATERKWFDKKANTKQKETEWHNVVVWGKQAEVAGQYLTKGSKVAVEGRIATRSWDDKQSGEKKYRTEIVCENFEMLGGGTGSGGNFGGGGGGNRREEEHGGGGGYGGGEDDDDIPF